MYGELWGYDIINSLLHIHVSWNLSWKLRKNKRLWFQMFYCYSLFILSSKLTQYNRGEWDKLSHFSDFGLWELN